MQRVPYAPYPSSSSASSASSSSSTLPASYIPYSQFASGKNSSYTEPEPASITANGGMDDDFDFDAACMLALEKAEKDHVEKKSNKREITMDAENADDGDMSQATQAQFMSQETLYHSQQVEGHSQGEGEGDDGMVEGHSQGEGEGEGEGDDGMVEGHSQGEGEGDLVEGGNLTVAVHSPVLTAPDCVEDSENIVDRHEETVDPVHQSELTEYFNEDNDSAAKGEEAVDQVRNSPLHHQGENENEELEDVDS